MTYEAKNRNISFDVEIIRKNNKNVYFIFKEDLKLYVSAPIFLSQNSILNILSENEDSILKMYDKMADKVHDNEYFWYLGNKYLINIDESVDEVKMEDGKVYTKSMDMLDKFYKEEVIKVFTKEVEIAKQCFSNLPNFRLKYRRMLTRWGVCNPTKCTVTLNTELLKKDVTLIDYVIIHELCHFFEGNHSKEFWALVGQAYPNYKEARRKLR